MKSDILLPTTIHKMQQIHPETEVIEIPDTGHAPALMNKEQHELVYKWLRSFD
jgi:hypothetical protein